MKKDNVIATVADNSPANFVSELVNEFSECISVRESMMKIPQLKLDNPLSESVKGQMSQPGHFSCFTRGLTFGPSVTIIPLLISESASLLSAGANTEIICTSRDLLTNMDGIPCVKCPHNAYWNDWGTKENPKKPACNSSIDIIAIVQPFDLHQVMKISFRINNHKAGRALVNLINGDPRRVPFGRSYELFSKEATKNGHDFFIINPKKIKMTPLTDEQIKQVIPTARELLKAKRENNITYGTHEEDVDNGIPM